MTEVAADPLFRLLAAIPARRPDRGIVYRHYDGSGTLLYVDSTTAGRHFRERQVKHVGSARWWRWVTEVTSEPHPDRRAAYLAETTAIHVERPVFNTLAADPFAQETAEARYVAANQHVVDRWSPKRAALRGLSPGARRAGFDEILRQAGVKL